jgi:hypothetical protein
MVFAIGSWMESWDIVLIAIVLLREIMYIYPPYESPIRLLHGGAASANHGCCTKCDSSNFGPFPILLGKLNCQANHHGETIVSQTIHTERQASPRDNATAGDFEEANLTTGASRVHEGVGS